MSLPTEDRPLLDVEEAARITGTSSRLIRSLIQKGLIPAVKIGRLIRIRPEDLEAYLTANTRAAR